MIGLQRLDEPVTEESSSKSKNDKDQKAEGDGLDPGSSKIIVSKSKRFVVNKVDDRQLSETRIAEDEEEETTTSPDNQPLPGSSAIFGLESEDIGSNEDPLFNILPSVKRLTLVS